MGEQPAKEPADAIIFGATALLAIVVGAGVAFSLWTELHRTSEHAVLTAAVSALSAGMGCIAFAVAKPATRLFLLVFAGTLLVAFFLGGSIFALVSP